MTFISEKPDSQGQFIFTQKGRRGFLSVDNPTAKNAISLNMMVDLPNIVRNIENSGIDILVVRAHDRSFFCAGGDLRDVRRYLIASQAGTEMCQHMTYWLSRLQHLPIYIVVVIDRGAIGGGAELMTIGDCIIAEHEAKIGFVQVSLGVTTGWGGAERIRKRIGSHKLLSIFLRGDIWSGREMYELGLIDILSENLDIELENHLQKIEKFPQNALHQLCKMAKGGCCEQDAFSASWGSVEHRAALGLSPQNKD